MERFADIQILKYKLKDFESLSLKQKSLIYCLSQATLWGRDITFDQFGKHNLKIRQLLESIYLYYKDKDTNFALDINTQDSERDCTDLSADDEFASLFTYLKQVWFSSGIYHHYSTRKIVPLFSEKYFRNLVLALPKDYYPFSEDEKREILLCELLPVMFNAELMPERVCQDATKDLVQSSACNYYEGLTQTEATEYYQKMQSDYAEKTGEHDQQPSWGLNTRLVKHDGKLEEEVYRLGGRYTQHISHIIEWLDKALAYTEDSIQHETIKLLIEYYKTGDLSLFDQYSISWLKQTESCVDFINGFIEVYGDPLGIKGSWEGIVHYKDLEATHRTEILSRSAQWFEDHSPVDPRFKKKVVQGVTANVVCAAMLGGDEYPSTAIGINLPNADWIRSTHGSKSITISNITAAYAEASKNNGFLDEYVEDGEMRDLIRKYGHLTDDLHTDMHECIGHGSGQILPGVKTDALLSYGSTIEETRADLFALYFMGDKTMLDLGLLPDMDAYKAQYYSYIMNGLLTQCVRIPLGEDIQECHMRNRALIAHWIKAAYPDLITIYQHNEKSYLRIKDFETLRQAFGVLLAEIQRIKSEGDYEAARKIVEDYGVHIDYDLHKEIKNRYESLDIAPYKGFVNPVLTPVTDSDGSITDIIVSEEEYVEQMLRYSREYSCQSLY